MSINERYSPYSDRRFETLFEQAPFSIQVLAPDGRTLRVNKAWETLWQATTENGLVRYVLDEYNVLHDPQLQAKGITSQIRRALAGESVEMAPIAYDPAESGRSEPPRWVKASAHPVKDESGAVREVMLIHEDVSFNAQAEQARLSSELRLKQLANTISQMAWIANPDGSIHWFNDRWYDYTGTTPEEMIGSGWHSVHDPLVLPAALERYAQSLASGEGFQMTFPLRGKDGRFRPFLTLSAPLRDEDGNIVQWFGSNTDVSALHEAERSLREAEERLRLATLAGHIGIWEWDFATDVVTWSEQLHSLHGLAPGSFGGRAADFTALVHSDDLPDLWRKIEAAIAGSTDFFAEFRAMLPDGKCRWLSAWAQVAANERGGTARMVGATINIDPYKQAEQALRDSDRRKDEFLAMLAHELRNPLAAIGAASQVMNLRIAEPVHARRASEIISRQVAHMTGLVDDLLDVARVTRGLISIDHAVVDMKLVIEQAIEQSLPLIETFAHVLTTHIDPAPALVRGDRTRLIQALVNILGNAAKYTPRSGHIDLTLQVHGGEIELSVTDDGVGIETALLPHLFQLFVQGARGAGRADGGLGIGLALVKGIVDLHGARVDAFSEGPGTGSRFRMIMPTETVDEDAHPIDPVETPPAARSLQILLVDDNRDAADMLKELLELAGHRVVVRNDAQSALSYLNAEPPRVFILDIGLPDMDGQELAMRLREQANGRANEVAKTSTFIALTGYGQPEDRQRSADAGFDHHLVKPVDIDALLGLLASID